MTETVVNRMPWGGAAEREPLPLLTREWLVTNGLGGYASGSVSGACTRRFHGLLIAALPAPLGRTLMLTHLTEVVRRPDGSSIRIGGQERAGGVIELHGAEKLTEFRLESGLPVWRYDLGDTVLEKRVFLPHTQNTVLVTYRVVTGEQTLRLKIRPSMHFRPHEGRVDTPPAQSYVLTARDAHYEIAADPALPPLRLRLLGPNAAFTDEPQRSVDVHYRIEEARGYDFRGDLWSPGYFRVDLGPGQPVTLIGSTEAWPVIEALTPDEAFAAELERRRRLVSMAARPARGGLGAELVLAADQFIITPAGRIEDATRARAAGDEVRTVIAGYHWFTDWGRDTMISLEGLTLCTGRHAEAAYILRTFGHYVRDGLIPNMFPEGEKAGLYHTADATLWFFQAIHRYVEVTGDRETLRLLLPRLRDIIARHVKGTGFNIHVDPADGLLSQGQAGYQLTWMDAKVDDWVVTPRRGKAVEINALWYNALRLLERWVREEIGESDADTYADLAERARQAFNARFWYAAGGHLFDVVDGENGDDPACRPNQVLAISLAHPVLDRARWADVMKVVEAKLVTPVGLRSLAPGHPDYKRTYDGDLRARDAAYHQGTVWAWLIGPYVDAWLKLHPEDRAGARALLTGFAPHLQEACIGSISEIFDAEAPFTPRGCVAQAWSVAEVLRCWVATDPLG